MKLLFYLDYIYIQSFKSIVINKKGVLNTSIFYASYIFSDFIGFFLNVISIIINYRILKNIYYYAAVFVLCFILIFYFYEVKNRRENVIGDFENYKKTFYVDILLFISVFLFFFSIYLTNEYFTPTS